MVAALLMPYVARQRRIVGGVVQEGENERVGGSYTPAAYRAPFRVDRVAELPIPLLGPATAILTTISAYFIHVQCTCGNLDLRRHPGGAAAAGCSALPQTPYTQSSEAGRGLERMQMLQRTYRIYHYRHYPVQVQYVRLYANLRKNSR